MRTKYHNDFTPFLNIMNEWYAKPEKPARNISVS